MYGATYDANDNAPLNGQSIDKEISAQIRLGFVRKVYGILTSQLLVTAAIAVPFQRVPREWLIANKWILAVSVILNLIVMCAMMCCQKACRTFPTNYLLLGLLTVTEGVLIGFVSAQYTWQTVLLAAGITMGVFVLMTIYAWTTTTDFTGFAPYVFAATAAFAMFGFSMWIMSMCGIHIKWLTMLYDLLGVLLFTFFIIFDTQMILGSHGGHKLGFSIDDYCFAALVLYMDIIRLFLHLLRLIGERK